MQGLIGVLKETIPTNNGRKQYETHLGKRWEFSLPIAPDIGKRIKTYFL